MAGNTIYLDVVIDDSGTMRRVAIDSTRLADAMSRTARNSAEADRNIKGAAQASSNATKNFSKMSQGMGGLVAAYATIAAQVFALSAAYQFLLQAADFRILIEGQKALTEQTGVGYTSITRSIQAATDAQLGYKQAAQAAAIGTAAGLSATMLKDIASYSKTISAVLGRDLEDTFNRLVRGITKAEPELLDELGIVLRLADASDEYARSIGKTASQLTAYERTQGVALFTLKQAEEKYGDLKDSSEVSANGIRQLGAAFSELGNKILPEVAKVAEFLANSIRGNVGAVASTFGLLLAGVIRQALPDVETLTKRTNASIQAYSEKIADYTIQADAFARGQLTITKRVQPAVDSIKGLASAIQRVQGAKAPAIITDLMSLTSGDKFDPGQVTAMIGQIDADLENIAKKQARNPAFKGLSEEQLKEIKARLEEMRDEAERATNGIEGRFTRLGDRVGETATRMQLVWARAMRGMQAAALVAVRIMNGAFRLLGIIGAILSLWEVIKAVYSWVSEKLSKKEVVEKSLAEQVVGSQEQVEDAKARIQDLERAARGIAKIRAKDTFENIVSFTGNVSANIGAAVDELKNQNEEYTSSFLKLQEDFRRIQEARKETLGSVADRIAEGRTLKSDRTFLIKNKEVLDDLRDEYEKTVETRAKLDEGANASRRNLALEILAYTRAIPELQQYSEEIQNLIDTQNYNALATSETTAKIVETARNFVQASASIKAFSEGYKTLSKQIIDSAALDETQKRYVLLNNTLINLRDAFEYSAANGKLLGTDLEKLDATGVELGKALNKLKKQLDNTFNLKVQEQNLNKLSNQLGLFFSQADTAIELLNEQDVKKAELDIAKLNDQLGSLEVNKDLFDIFTGQNKKIIEKALGEPIGESVLAAGAANADQLSTKFTEASSGFIQQYKDENDSFLGRLAVIRKTEAPKRKEDIIAGSEADIIADVNTTATKDIELNIEAEKNLRDLTFARNKFLLEQQKIQIETTQYINIQVQAARRYTDYANKVLDITKQQKSLELQILNIDSSLEDKLANEVEYSAKNITYSKERLDLVKAGNRAAEAGIQAEIDRNKAQGQAQSESVRNLEASLARLKEINIAEEYRLELQNKLEALQAKEGQRRVRLDILKQESEAAITLLNVQEELSNLSNPYIQEELKERLQIEKSQHSLLTLEKEIQHVSKDQLPVLRNKLIEEKARLTVLREQEKEVNKISQAVKGAFGEGIEQEIAAFLKGGQADIETSFLNIIKSVGEAAADQMAKTATNFILDGLGLGEESEAEKIKKGMQEAANYADSKISTAMKSAGDSSAEQLKAALAEAEALISSSLKIALTEGSDYSSNTIKTAMEEAARYTANLIKEAYASVQPKMPMEESKEEAKLPVVPQAVKVSGIKQVSGVDSVSNPTAVPSSSQPAAPLSVKVTGIEELEACIVRALSTGATTVEQAITRAFNTFTPPSIANPEPTVSASESDNPTKFYSEILRGSQEGAQLFYDKIVTASNKGTPPVPTIPPATSSVVADTEPSTNSVGMTIANGAKKIGTDIRNFGNKVQETFASDAPFLDKLGSIFSADAPWINSMTRGLAGALGGLAVGALGGGSGNGWRNAIIGGVVSGLSFGFSSWLGGLGNTPQTPGGNTPQIPGGTDSYSSIPFGLKAANGGIAMGGFRAFAEGGIVNKPTLGLVGEGRYNEAVVPLPDGKSIPVIMQTGGGDRNNIGININVNSNGQMQSDAQATGERGVAMAQAIQSVVQLELKRQKRPGGLLSPF